MHYQEIEHAPIAKLRKLQGERLRSVVERVYHSVPFYKGKMDATGMSPKDIQTIDDIEKLPFTTKEDLREHYPFGLFAVPQQEIVRIHASSGTTGKPTVVGYTVNDINAFAEVNARSLFAAGARKGMKLHNSYGYGLFTGGLGLHYGGERLGLSVIPVSGGMTERQLLILQDFAPEVICCTPSYAQTLAEIISNRGLNDRINLKYAVLGAEPWTESIREEIEEKLKLDATNIYGLSEIIGPGVSQEDFEEKGTGSTIWEDHFFPEVINKDTREPLAHESEGVLVFTTLTKEGMPLLRYITNDITSIYYDPGSKRSHIKMAAIRGRADGMLIIRGVNLFPTQVEELIHDIDELSTNYQLVVDKEDAMDQVTVRVELKESVSAVLGGVQGQVISRLEHAIRDSIGLRMKVEIAAAGTIPRSEGGKLNRVRDNREPGKD